MSELQKLPVVCFLVIFCSCLQEWAPSGTVTALNINNRAQAGSQMVSQSRGCLLREQDTLTKRCPSSQAVTHNKVPQTAAKTQASSSPYLTIKPSTTLMVMLFHSPALSDNGFSDLEILGSLTSTLPAPISSSVKWG